MIQLAQKKKEKEEVKEQLDAETINEMNFA
jgi:hypothetical protein